MLVATTPFDADLLTRLRRVGAVAAAPDGTWLAVAVTRPGDDDTLASDLWRVPLDGGAPRALTRGPSKDRAPRFRADGDPLFLSDRPAGTGARRATTARMPGLGPAGRRRRARARHRRAARGGRVRRARRGARARRARGGAAGRAAAEQRATAADLRQARAVAAALPDLPVRHWDAWLPATSLHAIRYAADGAAPT